jgi:hypothetical protein
MAAEITPSPRSSRRCSVLTVVIVFALRPRALPPPPRAHRPAPNPGDRNLERRHRRRKQDLRSLAFTASPGRGCDRRPPDAEWTGEPPADGPGRLRTLITSPPRPRATRGRRNRREGVSRTARWLRTVRPPKNALPGKAAGPAAARARFPWTVASGVRFRGTVRTERASRWAPYTNRASPTSSVRWRPGSRPTARPKDRGALTTSFSGPRSPEPILSRHRIVGRRCSDR